MQTVGDACLGIVGAGQLGLSIACGLRRAGFPPQQLRLAHRGSARTRAAVEAAGLAHAVVTVRELTRVSRIVLLAVRPQDGNALRGEPIREDGVLLSCMAGVPLARLPLTVPMARRARIMPSPPYTIEGRSGIAGVWGPQQAVACGLCASLGLEPVVLADEEAMHAFTALGVCLPIALASARAEHRVVDPLEIRRIADCHRLPDRDRILAWALRLERAVFTDGQVEGFLSAGATRGGVTEAIVGAMKAGAGLCEALERGVQRSREIEERSGAR